MQTLFLGFLLELFLSSCCQSALPRLNFRSSFNRPIAGNLNLDGTHVFRESIPLLLSRNDLKRQNRVRHDYIHEVTFVVRQRNMDELAKILHDISNPASSNFGQHLSREEVAQLTTNPLSRDIITSYLQSNGATISSETSYGEYITANARIEVWEKMLKTEFYSFQQTQRNGHVCEIVRTERYWIPKELDLHIESVFKTIELPDQPHGEAPTLSSSAESETETETETQGRTMTFRKIRDVYNLTDHHGSLNSTQAMLGYRELDPSEADVEYFQSSQNLSLQAMGNMGVPSNRSKCETGGFSGMSNLGAHYLMPSSSEPPTAYRHTGSDSPFTDWIVEVADTVNPPLVISIGFWSEERTISKGVHLAFTTQAIKLGAMGVTIVASSGDDGAVGSIVRNEGTARCGYVPTFPSSNPFVTSVSATSVSTVACHVMLYYVMSLLSCFSTHKMIWYNMIWYNMIWYNMIWYNMI
jgi:tripeptidyl-peptidase I